VSVGFTLYCVRRRLAMVRFPMKYKSRRTNSESEQTSLIS
jgi:hypothetical protein